MESILNTIKNLLPVEETDTSFDGELIVHINTAIMALTQMGVGPSEGFEIEDETSTWQDFLGENVKKFSAAKTYIYAKVKLAFDSASMTSPLIEVFNRMAAEAEWRLNHAAES